MGTCVICRLEIKLHPDWESKDLYGLNVCQACAKKGVNAQLVFFTHMDRRWQINNRICVYADTGCYAASPRSTLVEYGMTYKDMISFLRKEIYPETLRLQICPRKTANWRVAIFEDYPGGKIVEETIFLNHHEFQDRYKSSIWAGYGPETRTLVVWEK